MGKIFISYSHNDVEFAKKLTGELQKSNLDFWVDWEGIPPTADWMQQIEKGIEEADMFIFMLSPDSIESEVCMSELAHAVKNGKRLIPIMVRKIKESGMPEKLARIQYISFSGNDFKDALKKLLTAINTDYEWAQSHSRLQIKARDWVRNNLESGFLLRGKDLHDGEVLLAADRSKIPHPTDLQREFVHLSRKAVDKQRRWATILASASAVAMLLLGIYGLYQANQATIALERVEEEIIQKNSARQVAMVREAEARFNQLSAQAVAKADQNFNEALLLGVKTYLRSKDNRASNLVAQSAISDIVQRNPGLIQILTGHTDWVNSAAISADGRFLASVSWDASVILWDISNPALPVTLSTLKEHRASVNGVAFSADGETLVSTGDDGLILWDIQDPSSPQLLSKTEGVFYSGVEFTQDNKTILTIKDNEDGIASIFLLNISDKKTPLEIATLPNDADTAVKAIEFNPANHLLFSLFQNGNILVWDITNLNSPLLSIQRDEKYYPQSIAISADGKMLATSDLDATIALWDITDLAVPVKFSSWSGHSSLVNSLAFSADGNTLASSSEEDNKAPIILWDISNRNTPKKIRTINGHFIVVTKLLFNYDDKVLISSSQDGTVMIWDLRDPKPALQKGVMDNHTSFAFIPNSNNILAVTNSEDKDLQIWDVLNPAEPRLVKSLGEEVADFKAFSADGKFLATSDVNNNVAIWDTLDFVKLKTITTNYNVLYGIKFSTDGKTLAIAGNKLALWNIANPAKPILLTEVPLLDVRIFDLEISTDGKVITYIEGTPFFGGEIVLWDIQNSSNPIKLNPEKGYSKTALSIAFSPKNPNLFATAGVDKSVTLWDITDPTKPEVFSILRNHVDWVVSLEFSPDGSMLASASDDKKINLWNIANLSTPILLSKISRENTYFDNLAFSPLGDMLASNSYYNTAPQVANILFWDITPKSWAQKACALTFGDLDPAWNELFPDAEADTQATCSTFKEEDVFASASQQPAAGEQAIVSLPACQSDTTLSCTLPKSDLLDTFCVEKKPYYLYKLPVDTTFEVLTPGFICVKETNNAKGEPRISCTGPKEQPFQVEFCNSSCANLLVPSAQCSPGNGLNLDLGCCAPLSTVKSGCTIETLILLLACK